MKFGSILLLCVILCVGVQQADAQIDFIVYRDAYWHPHEDWIAILNVAPQYDTIDIFTGELAHLVTLDLGDMSQHWQVDVTRAAWSHDGQSLAGTFVATGGIAQPEQILVVWDTSTWDEILRISNVGTKVAWSPSGIMLATEAVVVDVMSGRIVQRFDFDPDRVVDVLWHPTNETQLLHALDLSSLVLNVISGEIIFQLPYYTRTTPAFSPTGQWLALGTTDDNDDEILHIVDTANYQVIHSSPIDGSLKQENAFSWISDNMLLVGRNFQQPITIWTVEGNTLSITDTLSMEYHNHAWSPDGSRFLAQGDFIDGQRTIAVIDTATETILASIPARLHHELPTVTPNVRN